MPLPGDLMTLENVNEKRRRAGKPPLTKQEFHKAYSDYGSIPAAQRTEHGSDGFMHFLIGYATGIPLPSAGGIVGAMMHPSAARSEPGYEPPAPSYSAPEPNYSSPEPSSGGGDYSSGGGSAGE